MTAFATVDQLGDLLGRDFTTSERPHIESLLEAASSHLRSVIGQQVFPETVSTYTGYPDAGREDLPQWPVVSVDEVTRRGVPIPFTYRPGYITVAGSEPIDVTFTWGFKSAPQELTRLTCVLASQALTTLELGLGVTAGGLSSVALDDFKAAFADGGAATGMVLTRHAEAAVRAQFGRGGMIMVETNG